MYLVLCFLSTHTVDIAFVKWVVLFRMSRLKGDFPPHRPLEGTLQILPCVCVTVCLCACFIHTPGPRLMQAVWNIELAIFVSRHRCSPTSSTNIGRVYLKLHLEWTFRMRYPRAWTQWHHVSSTIFVSLPPSVLSRLHSNNLHCDCHLAWLSDWLRARRGLAPFTQCMSPAHMRGLNVPDVQKKDFVCSGK